MRKLGFDKDWLFYKKGEMQKQEVNLPHDAMIYEQRRKENSSGLGYFSGGFYIYEKDFILPKEYVGKRLLLEFEGSYRHTRVFVNQKEMKYWASGYTQFFVDVSEAFAEGSNHICVEVDNSEQPNSRWYSGSGLYRHVNLWVGNINSIHPEGVKIKTLSYEPAIVEVLVDAPDETIVKTEVCYQGKIVAKGNGRKQNIKIENPNLWSDENPNLYDLRVFLLDSKENLLDEVTETFGIRKLEWDAKSGLKVNGKQVLLRGGCIHHDNGVIGACAFDDAEERKVRIMKEVGFNAIRSAHNPCSKALLNACDKYGLYVMDEAFDSWYIPKNSKDYSMDFENWYQQDLTAMVNKDYNHPSVIMYSIGNEVIETAQKKGVGYAENMVQLIKKLDSSRPITCGISITQNMDEFEGKNASKEQYMGGIEKKEEQTQASEDTKLTKEMLMGVNAYMYQLGVDNEKKANTQEAEDALNSICSILDISGYNYGEEKTEYDNLYNPKRVVVHSETHHIQLFEHWELIKKNPHIVGDFMWVGWDHLGEAGIGALGYPSRGGIGFDKPYPYITSGCGIIDITGYPLPKSKWVQMIWEKRTKPSIAVEPVEHGDEPYMMTYWNDSEGVASWSFPGLEKNTTKVTVYTVADKVELYLNQQLIGESKVDKLKASFTLAYEPGILKAVCYDKTKTVIDECELISADNDYDLWVSIDKNVLSADGQSLSYLDIELRDSCGNLMAYPSKELKIEVKGAGTLQGCGSGAVATEDSFTTGYCHTYYGRAQIVVRSGFEKGDINVKLICENKEKNITLECR